MPKVLVAEDDRNLARYYETLLSQWNCETVVEHTGTDAIRRAATFRPDVVLLGVVIPEMGGVEAAIKLLEICPGTKSALVTESVLAETLEQLGAQGYHFPMLHCPLPAEELPQWCLATRQNPEQDWRRKSVWAMATRSPNWEPWDFPETPEKARQSRIWLRRCKLEWSSINYRSPGKSKR